MLLKSNDIFRISFYLVPTVTSKVVLMISTSDIRKQKLREVRGHAQCCSGGVDELGFKAGLCTTLNSIKPSPLLTKTLRIKTNVFLEVGLV